MKSALKTIALAVAFVAASGAAHADKATPTIVAGGPDVSAFGYTMGNLQGSGNLKFSDDLIGALAAAGATTTAVAPGVLNEGEDGSMSVDAQILSLSGVFDTDTKMFTATNVGTLGGANMFIKTNAKGFASTGGSLTITGISVDLTNHAILGNITGANGVGTQNKVKIWDYGNLSGATAYPAVTGTTVSDNVVTGLTITQTAFDLFSKSLGLTPNGIAAMKGISDYGVMTSHLSVDVQAPVTPTVPEPGTYALMGLGLAGIVAAKRARRA